MSLPVLLVVDRDPAALRDVAAQLVRRYGREYRVASTSDPAEALRLEAQLADDDTDVALVLAAESLGGATGGEVLERARQLHPSAKRALMVPWRALADPPSAQAL